MKNIILSENFLYEAGIVDNKPMNIHPNDPITNGFLQSNNPDYRSVDTLRQLIKTRQRLGLEYKYISDLTSIVQNPAYQTPEIMQFIFKNLRILVKDGSIPSKDMPELINLLSITSKIPSGGKFADDFLAFLQNEKGNEKQEKTGKGSKQSRYNVKDHLDDQKKILINNLLSESIKKMLNTNEPDSKFNIEAIIKLATSLQPSDTAINNDIKNDKKDITKTAFNPSLLMLWAILIGNIDMINMAGKYGGYNLPPTYKTYVVTYINNIISKYRPLYTTIIKYLIDKNIITANRFRNIEYMIKKDPILPNDLKNVKREYEESKVYELNTEAMRLYEDRNNPWAICHSAVDFKKRPRNFRNCIMDINKKDNAIRKNFEVILKHNNGQKRLKATAISEDDAKEKVMKAEKVPLSSIISITEINNINNNSKLLNVYRYFPKENILQYMFKTTLKNNNYNNLANTKTFLLTDIDKIKDNILYTKNIINIITPLRLSNNNIINSIPSIKIINQNKNLDEVNYTITNPQDANGQDADQQLSAIKNKGYNPATDNITVDKTAMENSSRIYTKAQIKEIKFKKLCEDSQVFTKKDIIKKHLKEWHGDEFYEKEPENVKIKANFPESRANVQDLYFTLKNGDTEDIYLYYPASIINDLINNGYIYKDKRYYNWKLTNLGEKVFTNTDSLQKYLLKNIT